MNKHIKKYYLLLLILLIPLSMMSLSIFLGSSIRTPLPYKAGDGQPAALLVNLKGEIIEYKDKQKELKQGVEFWQDQLVGVRQHIEHAAWLVELYSGVLKPPIIDIVSKEYIKERRNQRRIAEEKLWVEMGFDISEKRIRRALKEEIEIKQDELNLREKLARYDNAVIKHRALLELEKIITSKLLKKPNESR